MANFAKFPGFVALDAIDWTLNPNDQRKNLSTRIPALRAEVDDAMAYYRGVTVWPDPPMVGDDTWGAPSWDNWYFGKAATRLTDVKDHLAAAAHDLDLLEAAQDPMTWAAGNALQWAHRQLKTLGLNEHGPRAAATPRHASGQSVAVVVWEARNQHEHWLDTNALSTRVLDCFRLLFAHDPARFGMQGSPLDDQSLAATLKSQSWAPQVLLTLGWTDSQKAADGLASIESRADGNAG